MELNFTPPKALMQFGNGNKPVASLLRNILTTIALIAFVQSKAQITCTPAPSNLMDSNPVFAVSGNVTRGGNASKHNAPRLISEFKLVGVPTLGFCISFSMTKNCFV